MTDETNSGYWCDLCNKDLRKCECEVKVRRCTCDAAPGGHYPECDMVREFEEVERRDLYFALEHACVNCSDKEYYDRISDLRLKVLKGLDEIQIVGELTEEDERGCY